jgi:glycerol-3-phosphate acyltransferase PlsX
VADRVVVAVDAMGGDHAPAEIVAGALQARDDGVDVLLVGDEGAIGPLLPRKASIPVRHAAEVVADGEAPAAAVRARPQASVVVAVEAVRDGAAAAVVSCGATGALMVAAVTRLGLVTGVERPAVATLLPRSDGGRVVLLDAGANVDCRPEQLLSFARLGSAYAVALGVAVPRVGLLSNGEEDGKGNQQTRAALPLLRGASGLHVVGNIEPMAAMAGGCDVLVCDGFVGNVLLKAAEGAVATVVGLLGEEVSRSPTGSLGKWLLSPAFGRFRRKIAWDAHGGALLLGVAGTVVVGHGKARAAAVRAAIGVAHRAAQHGTVAAVRAALG